MPISRKLDYVLLDMIQSSQRTIRSAPMNLGGIPGSGGGEGAPPGGFIGWLPQTRVAYDTDEYASLDTPSGGSLLDNLNHIRYRLGAVETLAGKITVVDSNTPATYTSVDTIYFSGGVEITDLGSGDILVVVSGGPGGGGVEEAPIDGNPYSRKDGTWVIASGGTGAALTVEQYGGSPTVTNVDTIIFSGATVVDNGSGDVTIIISGGSGGISDAPSDGTTYGRKDGTWVIVSGSGGRYRQYVYSTSVRSDHPVTQSFNAEGILAVVSGAMGAYIVAVESGVLDSVYMYVDNPGTAGQTVVDVNKNGTTVFTDQSMRPVVVYNDSDKKYEAYPSVSGLVKGDILTFDIDTVASGAAGLTIAPIITPILGFGFVTSAGEPVTVLLDLE